MVRIYRLLITGSGRLSRGLVGFAEAVGEQIILNTDIVLVTAGLRSITQGIPTVDFSVVQGALRQLQVLKHDPAQRILTVLPEHEYAKARTFTIGNVITARHLRRTIIGIGSKPLEVPAP